MHKSVITSTILTLLILLIATLSLFLITIVPAHMATATDVAGKKICRSRPRRLRYRLQ